MHVKIPLHTRFIITVVKLILKEGLIMNNILENLTINNANTQAMTNNTARDDSVN